MKSAQYDLSKEDSFFVPTPVQHIDGMFAPEIYENLPASLSQLLEIANNRQERDVLLLGAITVISGCLPNIYGIYDNRIVYPHLFTFVDAPAGAGKGILNHLRSLGKAIHRDRISKSQDEINRYEQKKAELKANNQDLSELPPPPKQKLLFILANNSASSFINTLAENDEMGILSSTEADTLANSLTQDWGNFSDILRCAFHHESVEMQRRTNKEYLVVEEPRLSVLLTGTNGQFKRLIPNTENGLFSRFMYYTMRSVPQFRDVFAHKNAVPGQLFDQLGQELLDLFQFLETQQEGLQWKLNKPMQDHFVRFFSHYTKIYYSETGERVLATFHRSGLIAFRITMVLSSIRWFIDRSKRGAPEGLVHPKDLETAMQITLHIIQHSLIHMADMPKNHDQSMKHRRMEQFIEKLPMEFTKNEANKVGKSLKLSAPTITRYLVQGPFERLGQGRYRKLYRDQNEHMSQ